MAAATAYVVSPVDLVPEAFLAVFGLVDDAVMVTWLAGSVLAETERFLAWEARRDAVIPGTVVGRADLRRSDWQSRPAGPAGRATRKGTTRCATTTTSST